MEQQQNFCCYVIGVEQKLQQASALENASVFEIVAENLWELVQVSGFGSVPCGGTDGLNQRLGESAPETVHDLCCQLDSGKECQTRNLYAKVWLANKELPASFLMSCSAQNVSGADLQTMHPLETYARADGLFAVQPVASFHGDALVPCGHVCISTTFELLSMHACADALCVPFQQLFSLNFESPLTFLPPWLSSFAFLEQWLESYIDSSRSV